MFNQKLWIVIFVNFDFSFWCDQACKAQGCCGEVVVSLKPFLYHEQGTFVLVLLFLHIIMWTIVTRNKLHQNASRWPMSGGRLIRLQWCISESRTTVSYVSKMNSVDKVRQTPDVLVWQWCPFFYYCIINWHEQGTFLWYLAFFLFVA